MRRGPGASSGGDEGSWALLLHDRGCWKPCSISRLQGVGAWMGVSSAFRQGSSHAPAGAFVIQHHCGFAWATPPPPRCLVLGWLFPASPCLASLRRSLFLRFTLLHIPLLLRRRSFPRVYFCNSSACGYNKLGFILFNHRASTHIVSDTQLQDVIGWAHTYPAATRPLTTQPHTT